MLACHEFVEKCSTGGSCRAIPAELGRQGPTVKGGWKLEFIQAENSATSLAQCEIKWWGIFSRDGLWISSLGFSEKRIPEVIVGRISESV